MNGKIYLNTREAAEHLGLSTRTLDRYRVSGDGPVFLKFGGRVRYLVEDLDAWVRTRRRRSTSDDGSGPGPIRRLPRAPIRGQVAERRVTVSPAVSVRLTRRLSARFVIPHFRAAAAKSSNSSAAAENPDAGEAVPSEFPRPCERASAAQVGGSFGADILNASADPGA